VDGKPVDADGLRDALASSLRSAFQTQIASQVAACCCDEHGETARLVVEGPPEDPSYKIEGCCDALVATAAARLQ
jgi:hypothetical protein